MNGVFEASFRVISSTSSNRYTVRFVKCSDGAAKTAEAAATRKYKGITYYGTVGSMITPYLIYTGKFILKKGYIVQAFKTQKLVSTYPKTLRPSDVIYMFVHEYHLYNNNATAGNALKSLVKTKSLVMSSVRRFDTNQVENFCLKGSNKNHRANPYRNYNRDKDSLFIRTIYNQPKEKNVNHAVKLLDANNIKLISVKLKSTPWIMCLRKHSKDRFEQFRELSVRGLAAAMRASHLSEPPAKYVFPSIRMYQRVIKRARSMFSWTTFNIEWLKREYIKNKQWGDQDKEQLDKAFLLLKKEDVIIENSDGTIALSVDNSKTTQIIEWLHELTQEIRFAELRPGSAVPCIPKGALSPDQKEVADHIMKGNFLTIVTGCPGVGKSEVGIIWVVSRFNRVLVVSSLCRMVAQLRERTGQAYTIKHIIALCRFNAAGRKFLSLFDIIVWDEASNVSMKDFHELMSCIHQSREAGRSIVQLVIVMDENQQQPIGKGCPAIDIQNAFPECVFKLTTQHRQREALAIAQSAQLLLQNRLSDVEWNTITSRKPADFQQVFSDPTKCLVRIDPSACPSLGQFVNNIVPAAIKDANGDHLQWCLYAFRNKEVNELSHRVREYLLKKDILPQHEQIKIQGTRETPYSKLCAYPMQQNGLYLGKGTKITFTEKTAAVWDRKNNKEKHPEVNRGEIVIIDKVSSNGAIVYLEDGRKLIMDARIHINPNDIRYAYCITAYQAQGETVECAVLYLHANPAKHWRRPPLYVAWTRSRKRTIVWAHLKDLIEVAKRKPYHRNTLLSHQLKTFDQVLEMKAACETKIRPQMPEFRLFSDLWIPENFQNHGPTLSDVMEKKKFKWDYQREEDEVDIAMIENDDEDMLAFAIAAAECQMYVRAGLNDEREEDEKNPQKRKRKNL